MNYFYNLKIYFHTKELQFRNYMLEIKLNRDKPTNLNFLKATNI